MKNVMRVAFFIILLITPTLRVRPTEIHTTYFPQVYRGQPMSNWKIIVPVETTNFVTNPSLETNTTGWTNVGMTTLARSSAFSKFGSYSLHLIANAVPDAAVGDAVAEADAGETWTASCWVWVVAGDFLLVIQENAGGWSTQATVATTLTGQWVYLEVTTTLDGGVTDGRINLKPSSVAASEFYVDAIQFEQQSEATTHCDGDQPGCEWNGAAHASTSTRSALSRAGGFVRDLKDDYYFGVIDVLGFGMPQLTVAVDGYAILPGGQLNSIKTNPRVGTLIGVFKDPTDAVGCDLHEMRQTLLEELAHDKYPRGALGWQPVILRYVGADVTKEIAVHYESGLEANIRLENRIHEKASIRFRAPDPFWYELGETSTALDTNDAATLRYMSGRLRSTGQWDDLGLTANPTTNGSVLAICVASDKSIYFGGVFTGHDGNAGRDYIVRYIPSTQSFARIGGASDFNNTIRAITEGPDRIIYIGGDFTNAAADANADYLAQYDSSTNTVSAVSGGGTGSVRAIAFDLAGLMYFGGSFLNWNAIANADRIATWNGAAYAAVGTGSGDIVYDFAVTKDNDIYVASIVSGATTNQFWDGSAWNTVADFNNDIRSVAIDKRGDIFFCGDFTTIDGDGFSRIARYNGQSFFELGTGIAGGTAQNMQFGPDGLLFVTGAFTSAGGRTTANKAALWNGTSWAHLDIDLPGIPANVSGLAIGPADPTIVTNYDIWLGFSTTGASALAGIVTVSNDGTQPARPIIEIARSGGTSATIKTIRNELAGFVMWFDYDLLDGETLTIDLDPTTGSIVSSFFGQREDAILANSDRGQWAMQVGDNNVSAFVDVAGGPTITAFLIFKTSYKSFD